MDEHRTVSVSRTYVPNEYVIWLSAQDRERYDGVEQEVIDELSGYLLEHARRERLALISRPVISFETDERLTLGQFGIQARTVKTAPEGEVQQAGHGHTMVYSTADRLQQPLDDERAARAGKAVLVAEGKHHQIAPGGASIGRSRDCDVVLADSNVSRRHAEIRPGPGGRWTISDLGSTNGVRVNGRDLRDGEAAPLASGDHVALGTVDMRFEVS
jgi:hypothetical protein